MQCFTIVNNSYKTTKGKWIFFFQIILTASLAEVMAPLGNEIGVDGGMGGDVTDGNCIHFSSLNIRTENWVLI